MVYKAAIEPLPELAEFLAPYAHHFCRSEGREDLERYCTGHLSDLPRKNGDTIAAAVPGTNAQRLQELTTRILWDEGAFNDQRVTQMGPEVRLGDGMLLLDDTGFAKQGRGSVGVARQYSGTLGKVGNCQVAVTCVYADPAVCWPVQTRLYLPKSWTDDPERCAKAGVPKDLVFQTKAEIALDLVDQADRLQVPYKVVGADADYGGDSTFLAGLQERGKRYVVAIPCDFHVEVMGQSALGSRRADAVLQALPRAAWQTVRWRQGSQGSLRRKFIAVRAWRTLDGQRQPVGWLIGERPGRGQDGDWKYYWSNLAAGTPLHKLVNYAHRRWRIEEFHQGAKSLLGWDDYQGRLWTGFHRHATLIMLSYSFLVWQQWRERHQGPRRPGRPRDPFSPSAGRAAPVAAGGPPARRGTAVADGHRLHHPADGAPLPGLLPHLTEQY